MPGPPSPRPTLRRYDAPGKATGLVLLLHGGKDRSSRPVDGRSLSWRRMAALQRAIAEPAADFGVSSWLLRYDAVGWNGGAPVLDARAALAEARRVLGQVPVVLLGHSMGARVAVHVAADPAVVGVVGLAPWFPIGEQVAGLAGRRLVAAHGRRDRITSFRATEAYVDRARSVAESATMLDMGPVGHYLLRDVRAWNRVALEQSLQMLTSQWIS